MRISDWSSDVCSSDLFQRPVIDARTLYFNRSPSNLFRLSDEALARRDPAARPITDGPMGSPNPHQRANRGAALADGCGRVQQLQSRMTTTLTPAPATLHEDATSAAAIPHHPT